MRQSVGHFFLPAALVCMFLGAFCLSTSAADPVFQPSPSASVLLGTWNVDLRPTPEAEPYLKTFVVTSVEGNTFTGTFYDTEITGAKINSDWGTVRIAFTTADGSGPYHHSAVLAGDRLEGLTNSTGRGFLSYWSAVKQ